MGEGEWTEEEGRVCHESTVKYYMGKGRTFSSLRLPSAASVLLCDLHLFALDLCDDITYTGYKRVEPSIDALRIQGEQSVQRDRDLGTDTETHLIEKDRQEGLQVQGDDPQREASVDGHLRDLWDALQDEVEHGEEHRQDLNHRGFDDQVDEDLILWRRAADNRT